MPFMAMPMAVKMPISARTSVGRIVVNNVVIKPNITKILVILINSFILILATKKTGGFNWRTLVFFVTLWMAVNVMQL